MMLIVLFLVSLLIVIKRLKKLPWKIKGNLLRSIGKSILFAFVTVQSVLTSYLFISLLSYEFKNQESIDLKFPLKGGIYAVVHGGSSPILNYHAEYSSQRHALDFVKLNSYGKSHNLFAELSDLQSYPIFDETVYSPVNGTVVHVTNGVEDQIKKTFSSNETNMVVIEQGRYQVLLLHLKKDSIRVSEGETVLQGDMLAKVGNSGYSSEPHLHMHVIERVDGVETSYFNGRSVPFTVGGEILKRNDLIADERVIFR
ncbi:M23 family metallopeptidase [Paenibacillus shunpengii]|uniref:M23 family metallopeptidase n=1 Tax=Paenibacillus shunpengii TaxID=2054424 RepID=A0ABW5SUS3_9BACL|nr:M23 family metallopeptidase [Paenibacillus sp. FSL H7-0326]